jgi:hypothetical protein
MAISISGIYDLPLLTETLQKQGKLRYTRLPEMLKNVDFSIYSPLHAFEALKSHQKLEKLPPLYFVHGKIVIVV